MGYTTKFTGAIAISRKLTFTEARELLEMQEEPERTLAVLGLRSYLQWVPTESFDSIVWDGGEKFYEYVPLMKALCEWLRARGIVANGELLWSGEEAGDVGRIMVADNAVATLEGRKPKASSCRPLTMERLAEMALDLATKAEAA